MKSRLAQSWQALHIWGSRQWLSAVAATVGVGLLLGWVTVLIPNPVFGREIPPTSWSYPVWIITSVLSGMLLASYVQPAGPKQPKDVEDKASVWGTVGAVGSWFAIGCPVCNKIALLALGYTGALNYFGAAQPYLAGISIVLLVVGLIYRLSGMISCEIPKKTGQGSLAS